MRSWGGTTEGLPWSTPTPYPPTTCEPRRTAVHRPEGTTPLLRRTRLMTTEAKDESIRILWSKTTRLSGAHRAALTESRDKFQTLTINNPDAARRAIISGDHDAFLIDWNLGGCAGIDIISDLSASAPGPIIPITRSDSVLIDRAALKVRVRLLPKDEITPELLSRTIRYGVQAWRGWETAPGDVRSSPRRSLPIHPGWNDHGSKPGAHSDAGRLKSRRVVHDIRLPSPNAPNPATPVQLIGALVDNQFCGDTEIDMLSATGSTFGPNLPPWLVVQGTATSYTDGSITDITERRQRDQQLRLRSDARPGATHGVLQQTWMGPPSPQTSSPSWSDGQLRRLSAPISAISDWRGSVPNSML